MRISRTIRRTYVDGRGVVRIKCFTISRILEADEDEQLAKSELAELADRIDATERS